MHKLTLLLLFALVAVGCGGSGGGSAFPFAGSWTGQYQSAAGTSIGTATGPISDHGAVSIDAEVTASHEQHRYRGTVQSDGSYSGDLIVVGVAQFHAEGTFVKKPDGSLEVSVHVPSSGYEAKMALTHG